jgi:O-antigen/teichoic acid export membrane protein
MQVPPLMLAGKAIWRLVKIGFPIMLVWLLVILLRSTDRIIIVSMLSKEMLGYFAIGTMVSGIVYASISELILTLFYPRFMEELGRSDNIRHILRYFIDPTTIIAYLTPLLIGFIYFGIHLPFQYFLPKYLPSIDVSQILIFGGFFFSILSTSVMICIGLKKHATILIIFTLGILLVIFFSYMSIRMELGINGVAIGTTTAYFIVSFIAIWYTLMQFKSTNHECVKFLILIYTPFLYSLCLLIFLDSFLIFRITGFWSDLFYTFVKISIFYLMFSIILLFVKNHSAMRKLVDALPFPRQKIQTNF